MKRNLKPISANNDLNYFTNEENIPNQKLIKDTIWYFEVTDAAKVFKPLEFLNILEKQCRLVKDNVKNGKEVISHLKALPLTEHEKHILYGFILKWFGGYPVNNSDKNFYETLKLIENEFLACTGYTDEKHFCKSDSEGQKKLMKAFEAANVSVWYGFDANEVYKALDNNEPKQKVYSSVYELFEDAVRYGSLGKFENEKDFIFKRSRYKYQFNEWLLETKGWNCREDENYKQLLTKDNWIEFLELQVKKEAESEKKLEAEKESWQIEQSAISRHFLEAKMESKTEFSPIIKKREKEISASVIKRFCELVNDSKLMQRGIDENAERFCERVCLKYGLRYRERVSKYFRFNNTPKATDTDLIKVIDCIIPKIPDIDKQNLRSYINIDGIIYG